MFSLAPLFAFENAMNIQQLAQLLRNLLQMPKEMVQLMALLANLDGADTQQLLKQLLTENPQISLEDLQQLLTNQLGKSQDKLIKLLQSSQLTFTGSGKQMGDLMNMLSQLSAKAGSSPTEALHSTLSLYLPYYPLAAPQRFSLHFEPMEDDSEGGGDNAQLVLFIETISLGQFRITLASSPQTRLQVDIQHDPLSESLITTLTKEIQSALGQENLPAANLNFQVRAGGKALQGDPASSSHISAPHPGSTASPPEKQSVGIHPANGVSVLTLHAAYMLIRIILELDNRHALNQNRAASVQPEQNQP